MWNGDLEIGHLPNSHEGQSEHNVNNTERTKPYWITRSCLVFEYKSLGGHWDLLYVARHLSVIVHCKYKTNEICFIE